MKPEIVQTLTEKCRYTGSLDQLNKVRRLQKIEGPDAGMRLVEVVTQAGLTCVFCEDRALDLVELSYRGVNIGYLSKNGLKRGRVLPVSGSFPTDWPGGMLSTCGLLNTGRDCEVDGKYHPTHGRIGGQAADRISVDLDYEKQTVTVRGEIRESSLGGYNLLLKREIVIGLDEPVIRWRDSVQNQSTEPEAVFLLYHFNFGYPFLAPQLDIHFSPGEVVPMDQAAEAALAEYKQITPPRDNQAEHCYLHLPLPDSSPADQVRLVRRDLRMAATLKWSRQELPWLVQWKFMRAGDYALGIEPSTSRLGGRQEELKAGYAQIIKPFDTWHYNLELALEDLAY